MKLNDNQIEYLRGSITFLDDDPIAELTEFWLDWANANLENASHADGKNADVVWVKAESAIPVVWILSNLYDCPHVVVFNMLKRELRRRAAFIGARETVEISFKEAGELLGHVIESLVPTSTSTSTSTNTNTTTH